MPDPNSSTERFKKRLRRYSSLDRLMITRNFSYGGAVTCLIILLELLQVGSKVTSLQISTLSISFALPFWILLGGFYEYYIFLGKESYAHLRTNLSINFVNTILGLACLGTVLAIGGIFYFLMPIAAYVFVFFGFVAVIIGGLFQFYLEKWWFSPEGPKPQEKDKNG